MAHPVQDPYAHLPSTDIDMEDTSSDGYRDVMDWMGGRNVQRAGGHMFRNIPITSTDEGHRRINLIHSGKPTVSLIIEEKSLYLIAFRRGDGQWLHFNDQVLPPDGNGEPVQAIPIQLKSTYMHLVQEHERSSFSVGKGSLYNAYHVLLQYDSTVALGTRLMTKQRKALSQLIVMFCEAARFAPIYDLVCRAMDIGSSEILGEDRYWKWIKNWSTLSGFAMHCKEAEEQGAPVAPDEVERVVVYGIETADAVADLLRVILR